MRFIRVRALMYFSSPVYTSLDSLHIYLEVFRVALLGVGRQGRFSSHMFTPALWCVWYLPIGFFLTIFIPNTLDFWIKLDDSAPLLRVPLSIFCLEIFGGGPEFVGKFSLIVPAQAGLFILSDILGVVHSCHRVVQSSGRSFGGVPVGYFLATWYEHLFRGFLLKK